MKDTDYKKLIKAAITPSEFCEKYMNVKLFKYQKYFLDNLPKVSLFMQGRGNHKFLTQLYAMYGHWLSMKENDVVVIARPSGNTVLNKEELGNYLRNYFKDIH